jgi:transcription initiation factor TFIID subunit TAF12
VVGLDQLSHDLLASVGEALASLGPPGAGVVQHCQQEQQQEQQQWQQEQRRQQQQWLFTGFLAAGAAVAIAASFWLGAGGAEAYAGRALEAPP